MNRRRFGLLMAGVVSGLVRLRAQGDDVGDHPPVMVERFFVKGRGAAEEPVGILRAKVRIFSTDSEAESWQREEMEDLGVDTRAEVSVIERTERKVPADLVPYDGAITSFVIVAGAAAVRLDCVRASMRQDDIVWILDASGTDPEAILDFVQEVAVTVVDRSERSDRSNLGGLLPTVEDLPEGFSLWDETSTRDDPDPLGTPIDLD